MATDLIEKYLSHLRYESCAKSTIDARKRTLTVVDQELEYGLDSAHADDIRLWLWRDGLSAGSRETYYGAIYSFYEWAVAEEYLYTNPASLVSRPKVPQRLPNPVSDEQLAEALERAREPYLSFVKLAAYAGLRCFDIEHLVRERITQRAIKVIESKGGKARVVPTHPIIWECVENLVAGPITDLDAGQISRSASAYFNRTLKMPGVRMHRFRHWFGTMIQRLYKDLSVTQYLLGHSNPATTVGYVLVAAEQGREAVDLLPRLDLPRFDAVSFGG